MPAEKEDVKPARRHITTACDACRQSKIKCDGQRPCGNCTRKGKTAICEYPTNDDKRRVQGTRYALELLSHRVEQLTTILTEQGLAIPAMKWEDTKIVIDVCDGLKIPWPSNLVGDNSGQRPKTGTPSNPSAVQTVQFNEPFSNQGPSENVGFQADVFSSPSGALVPEGSEWNWNNSNDPWAFWDPQNAASLLSGSLPGVLNNVNSLPYPGLAWTGAQMQHSSKRDVLQAAISSKSSDDGVEDFDDKFINRFSARFGSLKIAADGKTKYIGAASTANFLDDDDHYQQREEMELRKLQKDRETLLAHSLVGKEVDPTLEAHFVDLYFLHQDPILPLVDRNVYEHAKEKFSKGERDRGFYSDGLTNAMCALGAAHEPPFRASFNTYPKSLPVFFAERAKTLLQVDIGYPSVATVQSLVLLSAHELASNKDAGGWSYTGSAMRFCLDLGLERDCTPFVGQSLITPEEANARSLAFWGCFVMNHLWGFHLGRPFQVEGDITVSKPISLSSPVWGPPRTMLGANDPSNLAESGSFEPFRHVIYLCETAGPIMHTLFGTGSIDAKELQSKTEPITSQLFRWKETLPEKLRVDSTDADATYSRQLLMLHMLYNQIQILLHRPWTARHQQPVPLQGRGFRHARETCISSAKDISKLLKVYEARYALQHMHVHCVEIISAAALIMIAMEYASAPSRRAQVEQETGPALSMYFRALDNLSATYDKAKATRDGLLAAQGSWMNRPKPTTAGTGSKRSSNEPNNTISLESKRLREVEELNSSQGGASALSHTQRPIYGHDWADPWMPQQFEPQFPQ